MIVMRPTVTGNLKRRGPALPGLKIQNILNGFDQRLVRVSANYGDEASAWD